MPLIRSAKPSAVSANISEFHKGPTFASTAKKFGKHRADKQAVAVALDMARKAPRRAMGGPLMSGATMNPITNPPLNPGMNPGVYGATVGVASPTQAMLGLAANPPGMMTPTMPSPNMQSMQSVPGVQPQSMVPQNMMQRASGGFIPHMHPPRLAKPHVPRPHMPGLTKGPILSNVPGRTDLHYTHVPSGSYVIPADIVSGRGQGNTIAGSEALQRMFHMGPYETPGHFASGGDVVPVRVKLAGGEIVVPPHNVLETMRRLTGRRGMTLKEAHRIMDAWVLKERRKLRKTLAKLPGPVKE